MTWRVQALGGVLRGAFGLNHRRTGKASNAQYAPSSEPLEARRYWVEKRKQQAESKKREQMSPYNKELNTASVPSLEPSFTVLPPPSTPTAVKAEPGVQNPVILPPPSEPVVTVGDYTHPWRLPGYEALRAYTRVQATGPNRERLLESFVRADSGDRQAQSDIVAYLQQPAVQQLLGGAA